MEFATKQLEADNSVDDNNEHNQHGNVQKRYHSPQNGIQHDL